MSQQPHDVSSIFHHFIVSGSNTSPALLIACLILVFTAAIGVLLRITDMQGLGLLALHRFKEKSKPAIPDGKNEDNDEKNAVDIDGIGNHTYPGLLNTSTTCYLNSALQALASSPSFFAYLQNILASTDLHLEVTSSLALLLRTLNTPSKRSSFLRTTGIVNSLLNSTSSTGASKTRKRIMQGSGQQDAQEFFLILVEAVEEEKTLVFEEIAKKRDEKAGFHELVMPLELLRNMTAFVNS